MPRFPRRVGARFVAFLRADFAGVRAGFVALLISSGGDLVTHVAFTHYNAVQAFKAAMEKAGSTAGDKVLDALDGMTLNTATGAVTMGKGRYASMPIYVARGTPNKLEVAKKLDAAPSGAVCA